MSEQSNNGAAQFRADLPEKVEQESVRTTIVGGRPPGNGQPVGQIPRGIEVLLKKAAVDEKFRELLLHDPSQAAASIELELDPVELTMLQTFPKEHLAAIIKQTEVPEMHRRTFLDKSAIAMLALLTAGVAAYSCSLGNRPGPITGIQPDEPVVTGSRPDDPCPDDESLGVPLPDQQRIPPPLDEEKQTVEKDTEEAPRVYEEPQRFVFGLEYRR